MGHSKADKAESHERIVRTAAARLRERGIDGVGLAELMQEAGLTLGAFYRHFASRDELVDAAVERALQDGSQAVEALRRAPRPPAALLALIIDAYLGTTHRDEVAASCAVTTLAADVARRGERARSAYARQVESYLELLGSLQGEARPRARRARAIATLSTLVGAVSMARAVNDPRLSLEILKSAAESLKAPRED